MEAWAGAGVAGGGVAGGAEDAEAEPQLLHRFLAAPDGPTESAEV